MYVYFLCVKIGSVATLSVLTQTIAAYLFYFSLDCISSPKAPARAGQETDKDEIENYILILMGKLRKKNIVSEGKSPLRGLCDRQIADGMRS